MKQKYISVLVALAAVMALAFGVKAGSSNDVTASEKQDTMSIDLSNTTRVLLETTFGEIELALYNETPQHRDNFVKLSISVALWLQRVRAMRPTLSVRVRVRSSTS